MVTNSQLRMCLDQKLQTLKLLDAEIVELVPDGELGAEIKAADGYQANIFGALTRLDKAVRLLDPPRSFLPATSAAAIAPPASNKVKLPKLALPKFGGDFLKWTSFWDSYESAVHNSRDLTDVDKFNNLRSLLERTAYDAIASSRRCHQHLEEAIWRPRAHRFQAYGDASQPRGCDVRQESAGTPLAT